MKIYLAAMESIDFMPLIERNLIKNAFFSYYYMRGKTEPKVLIESRPFIQNIIVDSGAHTFFSELTGAGLSVSVHTKKTKTKESPVEYFTNYLEWLIKYQDYFDYFVELDIGEITGQKQVMEWREVLKEHGLFKKCITVYHPDITTFEEYMLDLENSESKYVALEGDRPNRPRLDYNKLIKPAFDRGIKVHGFAYCKREQLKKYPFYSVDASSWKSGMLYGASLVETPNGLKNVRFKNKTSDLFSLAGGIGDILDVHSEDLPKQRLKRLELAIGGYSLMENYFTKLWDSRGIHWKV